MRELSGEPVYSFVVPVYDEEDCLPQLYERLRAVMDRLDGDAEVILVNDGSSDLSYPLMLELRRRDPRFKVIDLSRNFGHQVAITVGLDHARGQAAIVMDADLQDPPELALEMAARWREGFDVVYAVRERRRDERWFRRASARLFYRLLGKLSDVGMPHDVGDFRLADRKVVEVIRALPERSRYLRGMFSWVGYRQTGVRYTRDGRHAGGTKYPLRRLLKLATDAIVSFSDAPLRLVLAAGFCVSALSFLAGAAAIVAKLAGAFDVPGWASIVVFMSFLGGAQLVVMGVMGQYVGRIYEEVKRRPLYLVNARHGVEPPSAPGAASEERALLVPFDYAQREPADAGAEELRG